MPFNRPAIIAVLLIVLAVFGLQRLSGEKEPEVQRSRLIMGTVVEITAGGEDTRRLDEAVTAAFRQMERLEELMAAQRPASDIARLSAAEEGLEVSPETAAVIAAGLEIAAATGGAFDPTLGRLKALWGIETEAPRVPAPDAIAGALAASGPQALRLEGNRVLKGNPQLAVDLGGIAKGYAIDRALAELQSAGIAYAAVNAGGDMRLLGRKKERPWRIGIRHPRDSEGLTATLRVEEAAVVTSGDYERFFEMDGTRYHHLFDPRTGYPATASQSVTVVAQSAMRADALATAAFVLGPVQGLELLEGTPEVEGLIVGADGKVVVTTGLEGKIEWP